MNFGQDNNSEKCYQRALFHLGRRALSSFRLKEKLAKYFTQEVIDQCLLKLIEKNYLNDHTYLTNKFESEKNKGCGLRVISQKLRREGFSVKSLKEYQEQIEIDEEEQLLEVLGHLQKKKSNLLRSLDQQSTKEKIYRYLVYKGHSYDFIEKIWQKLTSEINH